MDLIEAREADAARWRISCELFATLAGADRLIAKYGKVPTFHDGEVEAVHLTKKGPSKISVTINWPDIFGTNQIVVTLVAAQVIDVALEGFSPQNVIHELWFKVPASKPGYKVLAGDVEIELEPIYGIGGTILLSDVEVSWKMRHRWKKTAKS